jgi:hypothetical protein
MGLGYAPRFLITNTRQGPYSFFLFIIIIIFFYKSTKELRHESGQRQLTGVQNGKKLAFKILKMLRMRGTNK